MAMSVGIDYTRNSWKLCLLENGQVVELQQFSHADEVIAYLEDMCVLYPEPIIALSSSLETTLCSLSSLLDEDEGMLNGMQQFIEGIRFLNSKAYHIPSVKYLNSIPRYRKRKRKAMGGASDVSSVATLLHRMRQQEAIWPEMRFLLLEIGEAERNILVVKDGRIVDGIATDERAKEEGLDEDEEELSEEEQEQAFWEDLSEEVAGLMATHHFEDIVVVDAHGSEEGQHRRDEAINRLGDMYQFYHYPRESSEPVGFESAIGAALIGEGLYRPGMAAEVVERLEVKSEAKPKKRKSKKS
ncbi:MAG TPA: hypothetical protein DHW02_03755 [Ktedonobacter sp.]|nr:hypothetical protein [Ktedonobacter sp.]